MEKVVGENKMEIVMESPTFFRVFSSHLFDFFITILMALLALFGFSRLFMNSPASVEARGFRERIQVESGLYIREGESVKNVGDHYASSELSFNQKSEALSPILDHFFSVYIHDELPSASQSYLTYKLEAKGRNNESLFSNTGQRIYANPDYDETYASFYISAAREFAPGYLSYKAGYLEARRTLIILQVVAFEVSLAASYLVFYVMPPLFFRRGRQTLGRKLSGIFLLGQDGYSPSLPRTLLYDAFHYLFFFLLGPIALFAPYFISVGMMAVKKTRQSLSEYVFALFPVTGKKEEIYLTEEEMLKNREGQKGPNGEQ